jgi:hypothetical protein
MLSTGNLTYVAVVANSEQVIDGHCLSFVSLFFGTDISLVLVTLNLAFPDLCYHNVLISHLLILKINVPTDATISTINPHNLHPTVTHTQCILGTKPWCVKSDTVENLLHVT